MKSNQEKEALKKQNFYACRSRVNGVLTKPAVAKNPNGFNYRNYLSAKQTYWILDMNENPLNTCSLKKTSLIGDIKKLRFTGIRYLENYFPPEISSLSSALIFGDRT